MPHQRGSRQQVGTHLLLAVPVRAAPAFAALLLLARTHLPLRCWPVLPARVPMGRGLQELAARGPAGVMPLQALQGAAVGQLLLPGEQRWAGNWMRQG